jgi:UDPglucose 6-dehydrogenase
VANPSANPDLYPESPVIQGTSTERVLVVGAGYVGLATAACLASLGHTVHCTDASKARIRGLNSGHIPIYEEGLETLVCSGINSSRLTFGSNNEAVAGGADLVFLCLPTPQRPDGRADTSVIEDVVLRLRNELRPGSILVLKSTVPVGTNRHVTSLVDRDDVAVVSFPEFLREGSAVYDVLNPDRLVIGGEDDSACKRVADMYRTAPGVPLVLTDPISAELTKYASNAFLATKVTFINAIADLCESAGGNVLDVATGMGLDHRIGPDFLAPGPGWGGSCFPKDTLALLRTANDHGHDLTFIREVIAANERHLENIIAKAVRLCAGSVANQIIALWGLTFKAHTDDLRNSPALAIVNSLSALGARVRAYDPIISNSQSVQGLTDLSTDQYEACADASLLIILTPWPDFRDIDLNELSRRMAARVIYDARNVLSADRVRAAGFIYEGLGLQRNTVMEGQFEVMEQPDSMEVAPH